MPAKSTDRRIQRTRGLLQQALVEMIIEKGYEATTVQDIIDRANVGRSTFYAHYADKQTLLASGLDGLRRYLAEHQARAPRGENGPSLGFSLAMVEHAAGHVELYRAIAGKESGAYVMQRLHRTFAELVRKDLEGMGVRPAQRELCVQFVTGAFMGVLTWWMEQGARQPPAEVDALFRGLVTRGLADVLGRPA